MGLMSNKITIILHMITPTARQRFWTAGGSPDNRRFLNKDIRLDRRIGQGYRFTMKNTWLSSTTHCPKDYDGKKLMMFENEGGHIYDLSTVPSPDGKTFMLTATAVGIGSHHVGKENRIAIVRKPIDEAILRMIEKPNSKFLNHQCDFVLFLNSPRRKARYAEPNRETTPVTSSQ